MLRASDAPARLSRRELLKLACAAAAGAAAAPRLFAQPSFTENPFTLGVASGDPTPDGIVLWTRLAPRPLEGGGMPADVVQVGWEISEDDAFRKIVRKGMSAAWPELGHSVHAEISGLEPARDYWYRFHAGDAVSVAGRIRTAPPMAAAVDRLRFAVCGCNNYQDGYYTAFRRIADEGFDFIFHTGDYIYEGGRNPERVRQHSAGETFSLTEYRNRYALYKTDPDLQAAHASAPFIVTWDDHEVSNNYAGEIDENDTPPELFLLRRAAAYQAYYEAMPLRASALPSGNQMLIYRRLKFGRLIDLNVLDTRQWRSDQACGDGNRSDCAAALDPSRTMLGAAQEQWLFQNFATAKATWTVIGQQVCTFARDMAGWNPGGRFSMDKWDGYVAARRRLYAHLVKSGAPNPIVLSGDTHAHFGADLKVDFTNPRSTPVGVEFTNTSISSGGDGSDVSNSWDKTKDDNPHIKYHSNRRGYIACTATPAEMRADFKILDRVTSRDAPLRIGGSLVVEAGRRSAIVA